MKDGEWMKRRADENISVGQQQIENGVKRI